MVEPGESTYRSRSEIDAAVERPLDQADPLLVLGQPLDAELREQHPQVRLHGVHATGTAPRRSAGRWPGWRRRSRPCRDGRAPRGRGAGWSRASTAPGCSPAIAVPAWASCRRRAEGHRGGAEAQRVAVGEPAPAADALAVHERAVARQAVVDDRPVLLDALQPGVQARDLVVPVEHAGPTRLGARPRPGSTPGSSENSCCRFSPSR